ncbi:uncharacterized protein EDB93DRAFT_1325293 [Suillus bovinus]|uniref:uncharacterized protein n=1 Tax=Suillus bovinus TaxID=48563 RepID=UPI001B86BAD2|nr:uncharacterized protein EDB93DRAFT_1325293 [Suillus bovinus]KAG2158673.1 hypothetical protein EDB93DRAFT_1325293 [Suillus bovinus]
MLVPISLAPLIIILLWAERKAKKLAFLHSPKPRARSTSRLVLLGFAISLSDLDDSIELHQAALLLRPPDSLLLHPPSHSLRSSCLNDLVIGLRDIFRQRGIASDLDEFIKLFRAALLLRPPGRSD